MALSNRTFGVEFEVFFEHNKIVDIVFDYPKLFQKELDHSKSWLSDDDKPNTRENVYEYAKLYGASNIFDLDYNFIVERLISAIGLKSWNLVEDLSIKGVNPIEIVTPILQGSNGISQIVKFCTIMQKYASVNDSTGLHVHVGASDFLQRGKAAQRLTLALLHFKKFEPLFDSLVAASRQNNPFAETIDDQNQILTNYKRIIKEDARKLNSMLDILTQGERYKKINLESLAKHKTIEFRQMQGTLNPIIVKNWVIICTSFVDMIITTEEAFVSLLRDLKVVKKDPQQTGLAEEKLAEMKGKITSKEVRSSLIRTLQEGTDLIKNLQQIADNISILNEAEYSAGTNSYYYVFSVPLEVFDKAINLPTNMSRGARIATINKIVWQLVSSIKGLSPRTSEFSTLNTVTDGNSVLFYLFNENTTKKALNNTITPQEAEPVLTAQKNLATKTGIPKGLSASSINAIKKTK